MRKWDELVASFTDECRVRGVGESTLSMRESELMRWGKWLKRKHKNLKVEEINHECITDYIKSRTSFLSKSSTCGVMSSMRNFGEFLVAQGLWKNNPLMWMQGPKLNSAYRKIPKNYQKSDLKKIFEESFNGNLSYFRALNPALISLLYSTGLRKGELLGLNLGDWDRRNLTLKIYGQKTGQDRLVPVSSITWKCLENYIQKRNELIIKLKILCPFKAGAKKKEKQNSGFGAGKFFIPCSLWNYNEGCQDIGTVNFIKCDTFRNHHSGLLSSCCLHRNDIFQESF